MGEYWVKLLILHLSGFFSNDVMKNGGVFNAAALYFHKPGKALTAVLRPDPALKLNRPSVSFEHFLPPELPPKSMQVKTI
jgi:hypothetical protein